MSNQWVFLNGAFCLEQYATIPVVDRGFLFGDGIFTTIRVDQGKCELLKEHVERLRWQAEELKFDLKAVPFDWIPELIQRNKAFEGVWRLKIIVTVKEEQAERVSGTLLGTLQPYQGVSSRPCSLCMFPYPMESPLRHIKSLSYLDHLYVRRFALERGCEDAITQTSNGFLLETGHSNLFWMSEGKCWIPDPSLPYLKGIFLQALLAHLFLPIEYVKATIDQIPLTANVYLCNALKHVCPVLSIDQCFFSRSVEMEGLLRQAASKALIGKDSNQ